MRMFQYYVPGKHTLIPQEAAALGLAYAFDRGIDCRQVTRGPDGGQGIIVAQTDDPGQLGYHPERQIWRPIPGSSVHVGHYKGQLPTPADLARREQLEGSWLRLDDGQEWLCPVARAYSERASGEELDIVWQIKLPERLDMAADGKWTTGQVTTRYAALWELAEAWLRVRSNEATDRDKSRFDFQGEADGAILALQANYRIGRVEAALLGLLNSDLPAAILDALIDLEQFIRLVKKKVQRAQSRIPSEHGATLAAGCDSSAGPAGEIPITGPRLPTSTT